MNASMTLEQLHVLESERTRISRDIHDNLGARLTEVIMLSDLVQRNKEKAEEVGEQVGRISDLVRETIRDLDGIVWAINPKNDFLDCLAAYICRYTERFLGVTTIRCRLDLDELPHQPLMSDVRHGLLSVVKEALNNVVKHSAASEVWVRLKMEDCAVTIYIEDNGKGFVSERSAGCGNGLSNMERRIRDLGGEFNLLSHAGEGTQVKIRFLEARMTNASN